MSILTCRTDDMKLENADSQRWQNITTERGARVKFDLCRSENSQHLAILPFAVSDVRIGEVDTGRYSMHVAIDDESVARNLDGLECTWRALCSAAVSSTYVPSWKRATEVNHHSMLRVKITPKTTITSCHHEEDLIVESPGSVSTISRLDRAFVSVVVKGAWFAQDSCGVLIEVERIKIYSGLGKYRRIGLPTHTSEADVKRALFNLGGQ